MSPHEQFQREVAENILKLGENREIQALSRRWVHEVGQYKWAYNFTWLGRPAIQFPNDAWALQEIIWKVRPDLIIETGIAHGGSLVFSASMLALLDLSEAIEAGTMLDPRRSSRKVVGIDIDIREHNKAAIEAHPMAGRIEMIQGSSTDPVIIRQVHERVASLGVGKKILVCLDSNHTHDHVLVELEAYAPLVTPDSYCIVFDTLIEDMQAGSFQDRPWDKGNNPKTAVWEFLKRHAEFEIDKMIHDKLQITVAPDGYLRRKP